MTVSQSVKYAMDLILCECYVGIFIVFLILFQMGYSETLLWLEIASPPLSRLSTLNSLMDTILRWQILTSFVIHLSFASQYT